MSTVMSPGSWTSCQLFRWLSLSPIPQGINCLLSLVRGTKSPGGPVTSSKAFGFIYTKWECPPETHEIIPQKNLILLHVFYAPHSWTSSPMQPLCTWRICWTHVQKPFSIQTKHWEKPPHRWVGRFISPVSHTSKHINQSFKTHTQKDQKLAKLLSPQLFPEQRFFWSEWVSRLLLVLIADYYRGWRMVRWWRSLVLAEGPGLGPRTHTAAHNCLVSIPGEPLPSSAHTCRQKKKKSLMQIR